MKPDIFNVDGCLNIGFVYQNYYMCEDYNSPQSVYWALKSFLALGLPDHHPFWTAEEKPLPQAVVLASCVEPPMQIVCNTGNHHYLLSSGQFCPWPLKATEAKYGKSAYSSHFGFSVPTGTLLQQMAPDSTIAISKDGGDTWRVPWKVEENGQHIKASLMREKEILEDIPILQSSWKPWKDSYIYVITILIAPCSRWPDWYVRLTRIENLEAAPVTMSISEGGFAIQGRGSKKGETLPVSNQSADVRASKGLSFAEATLEISRGALICSDAGASGIRALRLRKLGEEHGPAGVTSIGHVLKPDANTNLMWQRTLIPTIRSETRTVLQGDSVHFASAVFAAARTLDKVTRYDKLDLGKLWDDVPILRTERMSSESGEAYQDYINVQVGR